ncbi:MAG: DMT family transporter [Saprospiraceae bacterium]|jgi:drug/metabolite transporter (DMT)-like permease|nr:DMT family transporter [Saprospiraceae bacterium]
MSDKLRAYFYLHFCVFIWGFTAILGKLITLTAVPLVWWRVLIASSVLAVFIPRAQWKMVTRTAFFQMSGIGVLVALHWLCFYGAIKLSNASVAVATMATTSFFAALTEPFILKQRVKWYELGIGLIILPGMALVVGNIDWDMRTGFAVGAVGALLAALFSSLNKKMIENNPQPPLVMSAVELGAATITCTMILPWLLWSTPDTAVWPGEGDWYWLLLLSLACTVLPYYLSLRAMKYITAFAANLTINLEPVYGVLLAALFFREDKELNSNFYIGMAVILLAVFSHPFLKQRFDREAL